MNHNQALLGIQVETLKLNILLSHQVPILKTIAQSSFLARNLSNSRIYFVGSYFGWYQGSLLLRSMTSRIKTDDYMSSLLDVLNPRH